MGTSHPRSTTATHKMVLIRCFLVAALCLVAVHSMSEPRAEPELVPVLEEVVVPPCVSPGHMFDKLPMSEGETRRSNLGNGFYGSCTCKNGMVNCWAVGK